MPVLTDSLSSPSVAKRQSGLHVTTTGSPTTPAIHPALSTPAESMPTASAAAAAADPFSTSIPKKRGRPKKSDVASSAVKKTKMDQSASSSTAIASASSPSSVIPNPRLVKPPSTSAIFDLLNHDEDQYDMDESGENHQGLTTSSTPSSGTEKMVISNSPDTTSLSAKHTAALEDEVYVIPWTGEICQTYTDYMEKYALYNSRVWSCSQSGKSGLTYPEALANEAKLREKEAAKVIPEIWKGPMLNLIHYNTLSCVLLIDHIYNSLKDVFFEGETLYSDYRSDTKVGTFTFITSPTSTSSPSVSPNAEPAPTMVKFTVTEPGRDFGEQLIIPVRKLRRDRFIFSKILFKRFIKESAVKDHFNHAPWIVHPHLVEKYNLRNTPPPEVVEILEKRAALMNPKEKPVKAEKAPKVKVSEKQTEGSTRASVEPVIKAPSKYPIEDLELLKFRTPSSKVGLGRPCGTPIEALLHSTPSTKDPGSSMSTESVDMGALLSLWEFLNVHRYELGLGPVLLDEFLPLFAEDAAASTRSASFLLTEILSTLIHFTCSEWRFRRLSSASTLSAQTNFDGLNSSFGAAGVSYPAAEVSATDESVDAIKEDVSIDERASSAEQSIVAPVASLYHQQQQEGKFLDIVQHHLNEDERIFFELWYQWHIGKYEMPPYLADLPTLAGPPAPRRRGRVASVNKQDHKMKPYAAWQVAFLGCIKDFVPSEVFPAKWTLLSTLLGPRPPQPPPASTELDSSGSELSDVASPIALRSTRIVVEKDEDEEQDELSMSEQDMVIHRRELRDRRKRLVYREDVIKSDDDAYEDADNDEEVDMLADDDDEDEDEDPQTTSSSRRGTSSHRSSRLVAPTRSSTRIQISAALAASTKTASAVSYNAATAERIVPQDLAPQQLKRPKKDVRQPAVLSDALTPFLTRTKTILRSISAADLISIIRFIIDNAVNTSQTIRNSMAATEDAVAFYKAEKRELWPEKRDIAARREELIRAIQALPRRGAAAKKAAAAGKAAAASGKTDGMDVDLTVPASTTARLKIGVKAQQETNERPGSLEEEDGEDEEEGEEEEDDEEEEEDEEEEGLPEGDTSASTTTPKSKSKKRRGRMSKKVFDSLTVASYSPENGAKFTDMKNELRKLDEQQDRVFRQEAYIDHFIRLERSKCCIRPLGMDRDYCRYWWFDGAYGTYALEDLVGHEPFRIQHPKGSRAASLSIKGVSSAKGKATGPGESFADGGKWNSAKLFIEHIHPDYFSDPNAKPKWTFLHTKAEVDALIKWLDDRGVRERHLLTNIKALYTVIVGGMEAAKAKED